MTAPDLERRERNRKLREHFRALAPREYRQARDAFLRGKPISIPTTTKEPAR